MGRRTEVPEVQTVWSQSSNLAWMYLEGDQLKEDGKRLSDWGSVIDVLVTITLETPVQNTENAKSTGVKITITGYCMQKKLADKETPHGSSNGISPLPQVAGNRIERGIQESRESTSSANQTHLSQESVTSQITEGGANTHTVTMETAQTGEKVVALQTVQLILKNGNVRFLVNCFLD